MGYVAAIFLVLTILFTKFQHKTEEIEAKRSRDSQQSIFEQAFKEEAVNEQWPFSETEEEDGAEETVEQPRREPPSSTMARRPLSLGKPSCGNEHVIGENGQRPYREVTDQSCQSSNRGNSFI